MHQHKKKMKSISLNVWILLCIVWNAGASQLQRRHTKAPITEAIVDDHETPLTDLPTTPRASRSGITRESILPVTEETEKPKDVLNPLTKIIEGAYSLRLLDSFLESSQMTATLRDPNTHHTLFLPWDKAFEKLSLNWKERLNQPMWGHHLKRFLLHHMYKGSLPLPQLNEMQWLKIKMMDGETVEISKQRDRVRVNNVRYLAYTAASDGYAFMMDEILVPSFMEQTAFFVVPPSLTSRWIRLVYMADLGSFMSDPALAGTYLVPSNDAFDKVDPATMAFWESREGREDLRKMLLNHVIPEVLIASDSIESGKPVMTMSLLKSDTLAFDKESNSLRVNAARVVKADYVAANGLVHIIDQVLLPPKEDGNQC